MYLLHFYYKCHKLYMWFTMKGLFKKRLWDSTRAFSQTWRTNWAVPPVFAFTWSGVQFVMVTRQIAASTQFSTTTSVRFFHELLRFSSLLQETWCSSPCEWLWLGAKWPTQHHTRREGCCRFHFNPTRRVVSKDYCYNSWKIILSLTRLYLFGLTSMLVKVIGKWIKVLFVR